MGGRHVRRILIITVATTLLGGTAQAADYGGNATAGVEGTQIMAGVQFGSPPANDRDMCEWSPTLPRDAGDTTVEEVTRPIGTVTYRLYDYTCDGREPPTTYHWIPEVSSTTLANQASAVVYDNIPAPWGEFAPPARRGVVALGTWFGVTPLRGVPVRATAGVPTPRGPLIVTTTATPKRLIFDPGDGRLGDGPVDCAGPGIPWIEAFGDHLPSPCMVTYRHSSVHHATGAFPATLAVRWHVSYTSNVGASGSLGDVTVSASHQMVIREIHGLISR
jgi:hypothetical protein